jgi:ATP-dependent helicase/nuclease subunit B
LGQRVFTIAPGAPFLKTFATDLIEGRIVEGYSARLAPLELSDATIYVPTKRAAHALVTELTRALARPAMLLPRVLPLGALEEPEYALLADENGEVSGYEPEIPEAAGEIFRRMRLAELIFAWARVLNDAGSPAGGTADAESEPRESFVAATTFADAWHLAGELAGLVDDLIIEKVPWKRLTALVLPEFDDYWQKTLDFLDIAIEEWPKILAERGLVDKAQRHAMLIEAQCRRLQEGAFPGPVIAIGSTGTNRASAHLLAAIAQAPRGAIVLPGLDLDLSPRAWPLIERDRKGGIEPSLTHPQWTLARLLRTLQFSRQDVVSLGSVPKNVAARGRFMSQAMSPAEATDEWQLYRESAAEDEIPAALEGISFIEAQDEREEALALAIAIRHALESPSETAALITPDRKLARRVSAELRRWGVDTQDSAGEPLSARPTGTLARLLITCAANGLAAPDLAALFAQPLFRLGFAHEDIKRRAALTEIGILRSACAADDLAGHILDNRSALIAGAKQESVGVHAHPAKTRISGGDWARIDELLSRLSVLFRPLLALEGSQPLDHWVAVHRGALEIAIAGADSEVASTDKDALEALFDDLAQNASGKLALSAESYGYFFARIASEIAVHEKPPAHARVQILGLLEARLIAADLVLLGGLDETIWPPQARTGAFLNRTMREALGLIPRERRLGQTAHDFVQALGNPKVILSRARKRDGTPAVPSRFVQRMAALGGEAFGACRARGEVYLRLAREIDQPAGMASPGARPTPRPPLERRTARLSVTQIETLRRDPYALYAEKILGLKELDPLGGAFGAAETGSAIHEALARFVENHPAGPVRKDAQEELTALLRQALEKQLRDPAFEALRWPRWQKMIDFYLRFEGKRRGQIVRIETELKGEHTIPLADGSKFVLTARADRIELNKDNSVTLVDYKAGAVPATADILAGFSPQLTLEAAMALHGAFGPERQSQTVSALYLKLGGTDGGEEKRLDFAKSEKSFAEITESHYSGLIDLLNQFRDPATTYPPRPFPKFAKRHNVYDHLARVKEWSCGSTGEEEAA